MGKNPRKWHIFSYSHILNNATVGVTVNLNVCQVRFKQKIIPFLTLPLCSLFTNPYQTLPTNPPSRLMVS
jgi:hypothetical protein